jgi:hypothetical protein
MRRDEILTVEQATMTVDADAKVIADIDTKTASVDSRLMPEVSRRFH